MTNDLAARVKQLEDWKASQITLQAVGEKDKEHLDERFDRLEAQIKEIKAAGMKLLWVVVGLVIAAVLKFIFDGGLNV